MAIRKHVIGVLAASAVVSSLAYAGSRIDLPLTVTVNPDNSGRMQGSLGTTRNAADSVQSLGCWVTADNFAGRTTRWVTCQGAVTNRTVLCSSMDPVLVETAMHASGDSYLSVLWDTQFNCNNIQIGTSSFLAPKQP